MAAVTVLTAFPINIRKVDRRLSRAGYVTAKDAGGVLVSRQGRLDSVITAVDPADLSDRVTKSARRLLGSPARFGIRCTFVGPAGETEAWATVVAIARAVATEVPLAVLDDNAGTTYLVHPGHGLVGPDEYEKARRSSSSGDLLRRFLGGR